MVGLWRRFLLSQSSSFIAVPQLFWGVNLGSQENEDKLCVYFVNVPFFLSDQQPARSQNPDVLTFPHEMVRGGGKLKPLQFSDFLFPASWSVCVCCGINWYARGWSLNVISLIQWLADPQDVIAGKRFIQRRRPLIGFALWLERHAVSFERLSRTRTFHTLDVLSQSSQEIPTCAYFYSNVAKHSDDCNPTVEWFSSSSVPHSCQHKPTRLNLIRYWSAIDWAQQRLDKQLELFHWALMADFLNLWFLLHLWHTDRLSGSLDFLLNGSKMCFKYCKKKRKKKEF